MAIGKATDRVVVDGNLLKIDPCEAQGTTRDRSMVDSRAVVDRPARGA